MSYLYPTTEAQTDALEIAMDPHKLARERAIILLLSSFEWTSALDFGCGVGRYFNLFEEVAKNSSIHRTVYGVDPDQERIKVASRAIAKFSQSPSNISISLDVGDQRLLIGSGRKFDLILCSQVLGHVTTQTTGEIINTLLDCLSSPGVALFLIPFTSRATIEKLYGPSYEGKDFFFTANLELVSDPRHHRRKISESEFNKLIMSNGETKLLPVRSFGVEVQNLTGLHQCPAVLKQLPDYFMQNLDTNNTNLVAAYTVHEFDSQSGNAAFGDLVIRVTK